MLILKTSWLEKYYFLRNLQEVYTFLGGEKDSLLEEIRSNYAKLLYGEIDPVVGKCDYY